MLNNIDDLSDFDRSVGTTRAVCAALTLAAVIGLCTWGLVELLS